MISTHTCVLSVYSITAALPHPYTFCCLTFRGKGCWHQFRTLAASLCKVWSHGQGHLHHLRISDSAEFQAPPKTYSIIICSLKRSLGNLYWYWSRYPRSCQWLCPGWGTGAFAISSLEYVFLLSQIHHSVAMCSSQRSSDLSHHGVTGEAPSSDQTELGFNASFVTWRIYYSAREAETNHFNFLSPVS